MIIEPTTLPGVLVITPRVAHDERGFFLESFHAPRFADHGLPIEFVQDNHSRSAAGVLRGLHYQLLQPQGKLVRVARGRIFDVAVDIRIGSPTFGCWVGVELDDENARMVWIPPGFAHGFCSLVTHSDVLYKCTAPYSPDDEGGVLWSDPGLAIRWPVARPTVSAKDARYQPLSVGRTDLPHYHP